MKSTTLRCNSTFPSIRIRCKRTQQIDVRGTELLLHHYHLKWRSSRNVALPFDTEQITPKTTAFGIISMPNKISRYINFSCCPSSSRQARRNGAIYRGKVLITVRIHEISHHLLYPLNNPPRIQPHHPPLALSSHTFRLLTDSISSSAYCN
jgi:hypothetical protein